MDEIENLSLQNHPHSRGVVVLVRVEVAVMAGERSRPEGVKKDGKYNV